MQRYLVGIRGGAIIPTPAESRELDHRIRVTYDALPALCIHGCSSAKTEQPIALLSDTVATVHWATIVGCEHATEVKLRAGDSLAWPLASVGFDELDVVHLAATLYLPRAEPRGRDLSAARSEDALNAISSGLWDHFIGQVNALSGTAQERESLKMDRLKEIRERQAALMELLNFMGAHRASAKQLLPVENALERIDRSLSGAAAVILAQLLEQLTEGFHAARLESGMARQEAEKAQEERDRLAAVEHRWARLGAMTVPPLVVFSLLGVNTLPAKLGVFPTSDLFAFVVTLCLAGSATILALSWMSGRE